ncbi:unnamed protein product, partial [Didymodactylos carnosus]
MIDTGSTVTAINSSYLSNIKHDKIRGISTTVKTANGGELKILGKVALHMTTNQITTKIDAFIIEDLCADLLLGSDWFHRNNVNISYQDKTIRITTPQQQSTTISIVRHPNPQQIFNVTAMSDFVVPSMSERIIQAATSAPPMMTAIFTPSLKMNNKQYVIAPHAVLKIQNNTTTLALLNTTKAVKKIRKGTHLGQIRYQGNDNCCYINMDPHKNQLTLAISPKAFLSITTRITDLLAHLPVDKQQQLQPVLLKHQTVFDTSSTTTIKTNIKHQIIIKPHHHPIQQPSYRRSAKEKQIINEQVKEMLDNHIIRPIDGSPRFCVDYRKLNSITERDVYPLPLINDIIDKLGGAKYFTCLDLKQDYWQVEIDEKDRQKTTFVTSEGIYDFNVMPYGLSNAPSTFQRIINSVLGDLRWHKCLVYLDDIIVYSTSFKQHVT